jgi:hypothetical protein
MPKSYGERIEKLKEQREKIERRLNTLEQKATNKKWKRDTRRKIIVGGAVLAEMQIDPKFTDVIQDLLARHVGRPNDREAIADLLQRSPRSTPQQTAATPSATVSIADVEDEMARFLDPPNG